MLGAGLVLLKIAAQNASVDRAIAVSLHLVNAFLLLASLTLTAWWATTCSSRFRLRAAGSVRLAFLVVAVGTAIIGASGAVVALGDTLFPAGSLAEGLCQDVDPTVSFLIRLRAVHPATAVVGGLGLAALASRVSQRTDSPEVKHAAGRLTPIVFVQRLTGITEVFLLAPVLLQLVHLLLADLVWIAQKLLAATRLGISEEMARAVEPALVGP